MYSRWRSQVHFGRSNNVYRRPAWAVIHLATLAECKGLCPTKLRTLLYLAETSFAGTGIGFIIHAKIVLREASRAITIEERAVAAVKYIQVRVTEMWIIHSIHGSVLFTKIRGPDIDVSK